MAFRFQCGDVMMGCSTELRGETRDNLFREALSHARESHEFTDADAVRADQIRRAIREDETPVGR